MSQPMSKHCINFWIGDGYCDDSCNNIIDSFDGGDCCPPFKTFGLVTFFFFFSSGAPWSSGFIRQYSHYRAKGRGIESRSFYFYYSDKKPLSLEASLLSPLSKVCLVYLDARCTMHAKGKKIEKINICIELTKMCF